jgi:hypothetical protein
MKPENYTFSPIMKEQICRPIGSLVPDAGGKIIEFIISKRIELKKQML